MVVLFLSLKNEFFASKVFMEYYYYFIAKLIYQVNAKKNQAESMVLHNN